MLDILAAEILYDATEAVEVPPNPNSVSSFTLKIAATGDKEARSILKEFCQVVFRYWVLYDMELVVEKVTTDTNNDMSMLEPSKKPKLL